MNECEAENITYQASLNSNKLNYDAKHYKDSCETNFKKQSATHKKNHLIKSNIKMKQLSKEVWNLSQQMAMAVKSHEGESL